jgi:ATP-binding cassette subfamily F protein 3
MIKAILGEIKVEGTCQLGHNAQIGYFAQNQAPYSILTWLYSKQWTRSQEGTYAHKSKNMLGQFMFSGDTIQKK